MFSVRSFQFSNSTDQLSNSTEDDSDTEDSTASSTEYIFDDCDEGESTIAGDEMDDDTVLSVSEYDEEEEPEGDFLTE